MTRRLTPKSLHSPKSVDPGNVITILSRKLDLRSSSDPFQLLIVQSLGDDALALFATKFFGSDGVPKLAGIETQARCLEPFLWGEQGFQRIW